ncbi:MAG: hypothetical protein BWX64_01327 [Acidobacteria bacterium ADurb.Bin051]|nr:MAG: hypothetical protein BWX64_01327 [Acidobacteria bacterium ADurb.Bin051]HNZ96220.1 hypothetical protein [Thermoanaerobaculia bacterium]
MVETRHVVTVAPWGAYGPETVLRVLGPGAPAPEGARFPFGMVDGVRAARLVADGLAEWYDAAANAPGSPAAEPVKRAAKGRGRG